MKLFFLTLLLAVVSASFGQNKRTKPMIDTTAIRQWESEVQSDISRDGKYAFNWIANQPVNSHTLVVYAFGKSWKRAFPGAEYPHFTRDSKKIVFKKENDSLCILKLGTEGLETISHIKSYLLTTLNGQEQLAYLTNTPKGQLTLRNLASGKEQQFAGVTDYQFGPDGHSLMLQTRAGKEKNIQNTVSWTDLSKGKTEQIWKGEDTTAKAIFQLSPDGHILLVQTESGKDSTVRHCLIWVNLQNGENKQIWEGLSSPSKYTFSKTNQQLVFRTENTKDQSGELWGYEQGKDKCRMLANDHSSGIEAGLKLSQEDMQFSKDGSRLFIKLVEKPAPQARADAVQVDVWNYRDAKLQSEQLGESDARLFAAVIDMVGNKLIRLQQEEEPIWDGNNTNDDYRIVALQKGYTDERYWNTQARPIIYLVSTRDGSRKMLKDSTDNEPPYNFSLPSSPGGRYLIYFEDQKKAWFSYDPKSGMIRNITKDIPVSLMTSKGAGGSYTESTAGLRDFRSNCFYEITWMGDSCVLIHDEYDIWKVDPAGLKAPVNLTKGYGRAHQIVFSLLEQRIDGQTALVFNQGKLLLKAFNEINKYSGFYQVDLQAKTAPELLKMNPCFYDGFLQRSNAGSWIIRRMSFDEPWNSFLTTDFRSFTRLSDVQPQKRYNWLTAELIHWTTFDGSPSEGILYKPENFDPHKKYPVIFYYYERLSDELYHFRAPWVTQAGINIPYFVSRGYLVCVPDIHYKMGSPGEGAVNCVASAAKYLAQLPFVDGSKMAINGQSFGGYETNYLVTHTHLFAAAAEMAGPTDLIAMYGGVRFGDSRCLGNPNQDFVEAGQPRIGASVWQRPDLYIENSPIFQADKVTTPLLIAHSIGDYNVTFEQSIEFYTALRRAGKKVWMLQYDKGDHIISPKDGADYTIRLTQFFDHYLKDAPPPKWMTEGVSARLKGIETGLALDTSGRQP